MTNMRSALSGTKRADGRWQITVSLTRPDGAKVKKTLYAATQREVQDKARELIHQTGRSASPNVTVSQLFDICQAGPWSSHADKTKEQYAWARKRIDPEFGPKLVGDLRVPDVASWVRRLEQDPQLSGKSVQICRDVLRVALGHAVEMGWAQGNPAKEVRIKSAKPKERRRLSENEYLRILEAEVDPMYRSLWRVIGECGLRPFCEATKLQRSDLAYRLDCWWLTVRKSKTDAGLREVPVPDDLGQTLADREGSLFPSSVGTPIDKSKVERAWRAATAAAKVEHTNLYQLRKLAITRWALTGLPDAVVKSLAGHTDIRLTQNVYARVGREQILNALEEQRK